MQTRAAARRRSSPGERQIFATVGTTSFDALVAALDDPLFVDAARAKGYTSLTIQLGRGVRLPTRLVPSGEAEAEADCGDFVVRYFRFAPDLGALVRDAAIVLSHAGAGSIFEALRARKPLLVVVNEQLMDNHQSELAEQLAAQRHLQYCQPATLLAAFEALQPGELQAYEPGCGEAVAADIDKLCGFR